MSPISGAAGGMANTAVSITTSTAQQLIAGRSGRASVVVQNLDSANPVYVGATGVTSSTGIKISAGQSISFDDLNGPVYARSTGGTVDVRVLEVF